jgi:succinoglycan biosynthesis protein ExoA
MDAHTTYAKDYVRQCVQGLVRTGADSVGGPCITVPSENTTFGRAFAIALSHPFGVGNAHYKIGIQVPVEVDAVPFGCMWRTRMLAVGPYDERLSRSEDIDFTTRLRRMGGRTLLLPEIRSYYHARSRIGPFARHSLSNGFWNSFPLAFGVLVGSWRHYIPLLFLLSLLIPLTIRLWWPPARWGTIAVAVLYGIAAVAAGAQAAWKAKDWGMLFVLPPTFALLHLLYGAGTLWGLIRAISERVLRPPRPAQ